MLRHIIVERDGHDDVCVAADHAQTVGELKAAIHVALGLDAPVELWVFRDGAATTPLPSIESSLDVGGGAHCGFLSDNAMMLEDLHGVGCGLDVRVHVAPSARLVAQRRLAGAAIGPAGSEEYTSAFQTAVATNDLERLELFLTAGELPAVALVDAAVDIASSGDVQMFEALLENGLSVDAGLERHEPCVVVAASHHKWDVVKLLVSRGCQINATDRDGDTCVIVAAAADAYDMVEYLLDRGGDVRARNRYGDSCMRIAAAQGRWEQVSWLYGLGGV